MNSFTNSRILGAWVPLRSEKRSIDWRGWALWSIINVGIIVCVRKSLDVIKDEQKRNKAPGEHKKVSTKTAF